MLSLLELLGIEMLRLAFTCLRACKSSAGWTVFQSIRGNHQMSTSANLQCETFRRPSLHASASKADPLLKKLDRFCVLNPISSTFRSTLHGTIYS